jgi:hypothetical protein
MAPTKEEERKLKEYKDDSPIKLGPAEKFLKAVIDVPFAFKRVDAMLYIANFDSEVEYLKKSFETLEVNQFISCLSPSLCFLLLVALFCAYYQMVMFRDTFSLQLEIFWVPNTTKCCLFKSFVTVLLNMDHVLN